MTLITCPGFEAVYFADYNCRYLRFVIVRALQALAGDDDVMPCLFFKIILAGTGTQATAQHDKQIYARRAGCNKLYVLPGSEVFFQIPGQRGQVYFRIT